MKEKYVKEASTELAANLIALSFNLKIVLNDAIMIRTVIPIINGSNKLWKNSLTDNAIISFTKYTHAFNTINNEATTPIETPSIPYLTPTSVNTSNNREYIAWTDKYNLVFPYATNTDPNGANKA